MNQEQAGEILRANVKNLSEPLKSAVEFALMNFFTPSAADLAKKFLASLPSMTTEDAELKSRIDLAYFTIMNDENTWLEPKELPHEIWRDVFDYEGIYQVSNLGRVKSLKRHKSKIFKAANVQGYLKVCLRKVNENKTVNIHVLVARAFIPNVDNKPQVNHIDGNKRNNRVENLEWCTPSENQQHALAIGLRKRGCEHLLAKLNETDKLYILTHCIPGDSQFGFRALARMFDVNDATIANLYYGKTYRSIT